MVYIHIVIQKLVFASSASQPLNPPASSLCMHRPCFGAGFRLVQTLGAYFAKFQFLNHSVYTSKLRQEVRAWIGVW
jgi:hypothetical protein